MNRLWTNATQAYERSAREPSAHPIAVHSGASRRARAGKRAATGADDDPAAVHWRRVAYDDRSGIDGDIERILRNLQERHGYARDLASMELMRRLSSSS